MQPYIVLNRKGQVLVMNENAPQMDKMCLGGRLINNSHYISNRSADAMPPQFTTPQPISFDTEEMRGSMQKILSDNVGEFVVIEFLIGTDRLMRKQGVLYFVGTSYVTLYDEELNNFIVCDIFSIKFVYFYFPGQRPNRNYNVLNNGNASNYGQR